MPLQAVKPIDTRACLRPVSSGLVTLLRGLSGHSWHRPTMAGSWLVRDVVAHLLDTTLRRLSFHRDGMAPPAPPRSMTSDRDFVAFINDLNAQWVGSAKRLSPKVLTDLYRDRERGGGGLVRGAAARGAALFPVSWAGEQASLGWFDIGREFTELWHHQQQIRIAGGSGAPAGSPVSRRRHRRGHARPAPQPSVSCGPNPARHVAIDISGPSGGRWTRRARRIVVDALLRPPTAGQGAYRAHRRRRLKLLVQRLKSADAARCGSGGRAHRIRQGPAAGQDPWWSSVSWRGVGKSTFRDAAPAGSVGSVDMTMVRRACCCCCPGFPVRGRAVCTSGDMT